MLQSPRIGPNIDTRASLFLNSWINKVSRRDSQLQHCAAHQITITVVRIVRMIYGRIFLCC